MPIITSQEWDQFINGFPSAHILQHSAWGKLKSTMGWFTYHVQSGASGAQILLRRVLPGVKIAYIPKGPIGDHSDQLFAEIDALCKKENVIFLKIEPDQVDPVNSEFRTYFDRLGKPAQTIQPRRTLVIDLTVSEKDLLNQMKQKTRYNIGLAQRKGVIVQHSADVDTFYEMMLVTGNRDGFGIHKREYYRQAYSLFSPLGKCTLLQAVFEDQPLAAIMVFTSGYRAWYFYGASNELGRNRMPTYLLQWEAVRWSIEMGCKQYDLWGVPDEDMETLEAGFTNRSDRLWGVYRFKRGFGARLVRSIGAWDRIYHPAMYRLYKIYARLRSTD